MSLVRVNLLYMSIFGGILVLTVFGLRTLLKNRLPKGTFSILWCVALLRLLVPFSVDSPVGGFSMIQGQTAALQNQIAALLDYGMEGGKDYRPISPVGFFSEGLYFGEASGYDEAIGGNGNAAGTEEGSVKGSPINGSSQAESDSPWELSLFRKIIITGAIVCAVVFLALYFNCLRRFRTALPVENLSVEQWLGRNRLLRKVRVRQSDRISSPLTYGLVRPVILLPKHLGQEEGRKLEYILQHEMVHIRRFDGAWKLAMAAALCLHWFNPLVWVMYVFMNRDLELSCDEAVLRIFGVEARKGYALTLIGMEERRHLPLPLYSGFGKNAVEERIGEIMKYKKKTKVAVGAATLLVLAVVCIFATTSRAKEDSSDAGKVLSEGSDSAVLLMDPPADSFGGTESAGSNGGSGTVAGTDSNGDNRTVDGTELPSGSMTELPASGEKDYHLTYMKEGLQESEPAQLVAGQGFYLLIPREGWTGFGPDGWMNEENNQVEIWVAHFSSEGSDYQGLDREQIIEALKAKGYQEENGRCWTYEEAEDRMTAVELRQTDDQDIWGIFYTYPGEAEDGWGVELRAMAQTFSIVSPELAEVRPEEAKSDLERELTEAKMARQLIRDLMKAAVEKDHDSVLQYIAEGYEVDMDCLDWITEWKQGTMNVRFRPAGDRCEVSIQVITTESEPDSNDYLTMELLKEGDEWKIQFIGLEK